MRSIFYRKRTIVGLSLIVYAGAAWLLRDPIMSLPDLMAWMPSNNPDTLALKIIGWVLWGLNALAIPIVSIMIAEGRAKKGVGSQPKDLLWVPFWALASPVLAIIWTCAGFWLVVVFVLYLAGLAGPARQTCE